ncbi:MAG: zf-HC2 domain-containing protein [Myxococcota bacterium]
MTHLTDSQLAAWVAGELGQAEALEVEAHADHCADCAARLTAVARAEEELVEIAVASAARPRARRPWGWALAAAAAAILVVGLAQRGPTAVGVAVPGVDVSVDCEASGALEACEQQALERGLMTGTGRVPRYDEPVCVDCGRDS